MASAYAIEGEKRLPISETFLSLQGEGRWVGSMMYFVRLAGCTVGKHIQAQVPTSSKANSGTHKDTDHYGTIPVWQEECTLYDGRKFLCDTDFRVKQRLTSEEIFQIFGIGNVQHLCITGGEPLMHDLGRLIYLAQEKEMMVHIETSGTIPLEKAFPHWNEYRATGLHDKIWVTVSPKYGTLEEMVYRANEIKLLVDGDFDLTKVPAAVRTHPLVYLQPINDIFSINRYNLDYCIRLATQYPNFRVSMQAHKYWRVR